MIIELINKLTPKNVHSKKFRLGPNRDGGYVLNELLIENTKKLICMGYGGSDAFEMEWFATYKTPIDVYDGTCGCLGICNEYPEEVGKTIKYFQQNVGYDEGYISVKDILENEQDTLLKVDIEASEYTAFDGVDLSKQTGLLLEIHTLHIEDCRNKFIELMNNEFSCFELFHIHANNHGGSFSIGNVTLPTTYELSMVNKKLITNISEDLSNYPVTGLDYANDGSETDMPITDPFNQYRRLNKLFTPVASKL